MRPWIDRIRALPGALVLLSLLATGQSAMAAHSLINCPPIFLGDYPDDEEADWAEDVQGLGHDDTHWYLTNTHNILRIPVGRDFAQDHYGVGSVAHRHLSGYPELAAFDHFGDLETFTFGGTTYVLLAVDSGPPEGALALLRADDTLDLVDVASFPGQSSAGWLAVDPDGFVYSSVSGPTEFRKYSVNWADVENDLVLTFVASIPITDENGDPYQLNDMQGGVVTPDGKVLITSNSFDDCDNPTYGLHAWDLGTGQRITRSCESGCGWIFQFDACDVGFLDEEAEGLTIWDLDGGAAPGMSGQLHVLLLNNDIIADNAWMKHYDLDMTPPEISCPQSITVECSEHGGTPATNAAIAAFLAGASATDNCDDEVDIAHDAPAFFNLGTTTVTFTGTDDVMANQDQCTADVTIVDTTDPVIGVSLNRDALWPPNHKLADIEATVEVSDICDENASFVLTSIESNEPDDGTGDGDTEGDIVDADTGTPDVAFQLRSERQGTGTGREYTIVYCATDESGNEACDTVSVSVPHNNSGTALASVGFLPQGHRLDPGASQVALVIPSRMGLRDPGGGTTTFDASDIDVSRVYVGNTTGATRPAESQLLDVNDDTMEDLVVFYPADAIRSMLQVDPDTRAGDQLERGRFEPIGLHYRSGGADYLALDIFDLGDPVALPARGRPDEPPPAVSPGIARDTELLGAYPNPFNPSTRVHFALSAPERVRLAVYDIRGARLRTLVDEVAPAGEHVVEWNGRDDHGGAVASGIYFIRMSAGVYEMTRKVVLLK